MCDFTALYLSKLSFYAKIFQKEPEIHCQEIIIHTDPHELTKFEKQFGVILDTNAHIHAEFPQLEFFVELAAIMSFIPLKNLKIPLIRRILRVALYPQYFSEKIVSDPLEDLIHEDLQQLEQDLRTTTDIRFTNEAQFLIYIRSLNNQQILEELIPFLGLQIRRSELASNIYNLFAPRIEPNYASWTANLQRIKLWKYVITHLSENFKFSDLPPFSDIISVDPSIIGLNLFSFIAIVQEKLIKSPFIINLQELIAKVIGTTRILISGSIIMVFTILSPEGMKKVQRLFHRLKRTGYLLDFHMGTVFEISSAFTTTLQNLQGFCSKTLPLKDISSPEPKLSIKSKLIYDLEIPSEKSPRKITPLSLLGALYYNSILPSLAFFPDAKSFRTALYRNFQNILTTHKSIFRPIFPDFYVNSPKFSNIAEEIHPMIKSGKIFNNAVFAYLRIDFDFHIETSILTLGKSAFLESNIAKHRWKISSDNSQKTPIITYIAYATWEPYLPFLALLSYEPVFAILREEKRLKSQIDPHFGKYFNFDQQIWDFSTFNPDPLFEEFQKANKIPPPESDVEIFNQPLNYSWIPYPTPTKFIKLYQRQFYRLYVKLLNLPFVYQFLSEYIDNHLYLPRNFKAAYGKQMAYLNSHGILCAVYPHPALIRYLRLHIIIRGNGEPTHPEYMLQDSLFRGLFTFGLINCYYGGGLLNGFLILEYFLPQDYLLNSDSEFHRLIENLTTKASPHWTVQILEISQSSVSFSEYNLQAERFKNVRFQYIGLPTKKELDNVQNPNVFTLSYKDPPVLPPDNSTKWDELDVTEVSQNQLQRWGRYGFLFQPVWFNWQTLLFLKHPCYQFWWIQNLEPESDVARKIKAFFQQFAICEIFEGIDETTNTLHYMIMLHYHNNFYHLNYKILDVLHNQNVQTDYVWVFPWTVFESSPITDIIRISRSNPFFNPHRKVPHFPIFRYYSQTACYTPQEQLEIYHQYYENSTGPRKILTKIKKEFEAQSSPPPI